MNIYIHTVTDQQVRMLEPKFEPRADHNPTYCTRRAACNARGSCACVGVRRSPQLHPQPPRRHGNGSFRMHDRVDDATRDVGFADDDARLT